MRIVWQIAFMRAVVVTLFSLLAVTPAFGQVQGFPAFPVMQEMEYPQTSTTEVRARADEGEGYATLRLAATTRCEANDIVCEVRVSDLYRLAAERGQSAALAMLRLRILERSPSRASEYAIGASVCGRTRADAQGILRQIQTIELRDNRDEPGEWRVEEAVGSLGTNVVGVSRGPIGAGFFYSGDQLRLVRVTTFFLSMGSREDAFEAVQRANALIASAVCPGWPGLGDAIREYILGVAQSWPPQAVHVDGPSAWLAATGVTPDIFWFHLYVDPLHNPFTSAGTDEQFQPANGLGLAPLSAH